MVYTNIKRDKIMIPILIIVMSILCVFEGALGSYLCKREHIDVFIKDITLSKDVVFSDENIDKQLGREITLSTGMTGTIRKVIAYDESISDKTIVCVAFELNDGDVFYADIYIFDESKYDSNMFLIKKDCIEDSSILVSEYTQFLESYDSHMTHIQLIGSSIGIVVSLVLTIALISVYITLLKKQRNTLCLKRLLFAIDSILVVGVIIEFLILAFLLNGV